MAPLQQPLKGFQRALQVGVGHEVVQILARSSNDLQSAVNRAGVRVGHTLFFFIETGLSLVCWCEGFRQDYKGLISEMARKAPLRKYLLRLLTFIDQYETE